MSSSAAACGNPPESSRADLRVFLANLRPGAETAFAVIPAEGGAPIVQSLSDPAEAELWLMDWNRQGYGAYHTGNRVSPGIGRKPAKTDLTHLECVVADIDPRDAQGHSWADERERLLALADELATTLYYPPSFVVDTGNGLQPGWLLELAEATPDTIVKLEALGQRIEAVLGAKGTHSAEHLYRVPGTVNWPNAKKRALGRGVTYARLLHATWRRYSWDDLEKQVQWLESGPPAFAAPAEGRSKIGDPGELGLPETAPEPLEAEKLAKLRAEHPLVFDFARYDFDQSRQDLALANLARRLGWPPVDAWRLIIAVRGDDKAERRDYIERTLGRAYAKQDEGEDAGAKLEDYSHDGHARRLARAWANDARHVALEGAWYLYDGGRWARDEHLRHVAAARDLHYHQADRFLKAHAEGKLAHLKLGDKEARTVARNARSSPTIAAAISLARSDPRLAASADQWDRDPYLLHTPGGTVDLRTGEMRPPRREDLITKQTAVAPAPFGTLAPRWNKALERIFRHDPELISFVRRLIGYSLLGSVSEHVLIFCWGQGGNGKGVLLNTMTRILGDYATVAPSNLLLAAQSERHPCDMAMLRGARFVQAQELSAGRAWDEAKLKSLTGGDRVTARFMRQDFFTFDPQFTLWVAGNTKPSFRGIDEALRRRILLIPFAQVIPASERDPDLPRKLEQEWPAILRWAIDGYFEYELLGLDPPESAHAATKEYLASEDLLGQWLEDKCCTDDPGVFTSTTALHTSWAAWCHHSQRVDAGSMKAFSKLLSDRGFRPDRTDKARGFKGIRLIDAAQGEVA